MDSEKPFSCFQLFVNRPITGVGFFFIGTDMLGYTSLGQFPQSQRESMQTRETRGR
jgi:hypothetical protein